MRLIIIFCILNFVFLQSIAQSEADWQKKIDNAMAHGDKNLAAHISYDFATSLKEFPDKFDKALFILVSADQWSEQTADNFLNAKIHYLRAFYLAKQNQTPKAIEAIAQSEKLFDAVNDSVSFANAMLFHAEIEENANLLLPAIHSYTKLFDVYLHNNNFAARKKTALKLAELHELAGNRAFVARYNMYAQNSENPYQSKHFLDSSLVVALVSENEQLESKYNFRITLIVVIFAVLLFLILYFLGKNLKATNKKLFRKNSIIRQQQKKTEELVLGILPHQIALELKEKGFATPRHYESVTIMFTDFKGFTNYAEKVSPEKLIFELNYCFSAFDKIAEKYNLEKIKTIGDAYMCAGGIPTPNQTHALDAVRAGLAMQEFMLEWGKKRIEQGDEILELRIGINTGAVVAGVIGTSKFAYDIWGDAVNLAARLEGGSEVGLVNISESTYLLIKEKFSCVHRGKIKAKNKGEVDMYYVSYEISHE
jgi:class 3 adenylate cyclase